MAQAKSDTRNIHERLLAASAKIPKLIREKPGTLQYKVISHDQVTAAVRPALADEGVHYFPNEFEFNHEGNRCTILGSVTFCVASKPEDKIVVPSVGEGVDNQDKGPGKAYSYMVKYALLKALGLETGEDSDLESKPFTPPEKPREDPLDAPRIILAQAIKAAGVSNKDAVAAIEKKFGKKPKDMKAYDHLVDAAKFIENEYTPF